MTMTLRSLLGDNFEDVPVVLEEIYVTDIIRATSVQVRPLNVKKVDRIARGFDRMTIMANPLVMNRRNYELRKLDGAHRAAAAYKHGGVYKLLCIVLPGVDDTTELRIIKNIEDRNNRTPAQSIYLNAANGNAIARQTIRLANEAGFKLSQDTKRGKWSWQQEGVIGAVGIAMEIVQDWGNLYETLLLVKEVWPYQREALDGHFLKGIAFALSVGVKRDSRTLTRLKSQFPSTRTLLQTAKANYTNEPGVYQKVARLIVAVYNKGLERHNRVDF
jgi:hypothetical protein